MPKTTLEPQNWDDLRQSAHDLLDRALDQLQNSSKGRVWTPLPDALKSTLKDPLPEQGQPSQYIVERLAALLPFGVGNTHPRFFGWVHGAGNPGGILPEMAAAAMNANLGGRDHGAIYVERQVIDWARQMMGFPDNASGLITSGTSMGTIVALKTARDRALGPESRKTGVNGTKLVGYTSEQAHACIARAFDMLGLGSSALRKIPVDADFRMVTGTLRDQIASDRQAGLHPFAVIGTAGSVNVGAIDDLEDIADIAAREDLWFHVDGALGAAGILSDRVAGKLAGMERAHSLAFDYHKWLHVNYAAGCVLIRDAAAHFSSFSDRPEYLAASSRGLAAGEPWPVDFGPELSRGFLALKIWAHFLEHGTQKLGASITQNCELAHYLAGLIADHPNLTLCAPVALNIVCFRHTGDDALNTEIVTQLQEQGIAAPSTTTIHGQTVIRVNITNHRTAPEDMTILLNAITDIARAIIT
jgi:aromatic-L-amino-acid decarboxylase